MFTVDRQQEFEMCSINDFETCFVHIKNNTNIETIFVILITKFENVICSFNLSLKFYLNLSFHTIYGDIIGSALVSRILLQAVKAEQA